MAAHLGGRERARVVFDGGESETRPSELHDVRVDAVRELPRHSLGPASSVSAEFLLELTRMLCAFTGEEGRPGAGRAGDRCGRRRRPWASTPPDPPAPPPAPQPPTPRALSTARCAASWVRSHLFAPEVVWVVGVEVVRAKAKLRRLVPAPAVERAVREHRPPQNRQPLRAAAAATLSSHSDTAPSTRLFLLRRKESPARQPFNPGCEGESRAADGGAEGEDWPATYKVDPALQQHPTLHPRALSPSVANGREVEEWREESRRGERERGQRASEDGEKGMGGGMTGRVRGSRRKVTGAGGGRERGVGGRRREEVRKRELGEEGEEEGRGRGSR
eukprot:759837-Rhodomonas_salina.2